MKKVFLSLTALAFAATVSFAQTTPATENLSNTNTEASEKVELAEASNKKKITVEELPAAVQEGLKSSEYAAWEVSEVYQVDPTTETELVTYEVEVSNGEAAADQAQAQEGELVLLFNKEGELLETKEAEDSDK